MYDQARQIALNGNPPLAVTMLERVITAYPDSKAAQDAQQALDRSSLNLPLFPTSDAVAVDVADPPVTPKTDQPEPVIVEATAPVGPGPATADVELELPANPGRAGPCRRGERPAGGPGATDARLAGWIPCSGRGRRA